MEYTDKNYKYLELNNLIHALSSLREPSKRDLKYVGNCLDELLKTVFNIKARCRRVYFAENTDNIMFGLVVQPLFANPAEIVLFSDESIPIQDYAVEIDSKLFNTELTDEDVTALILYNIIHLVKDNTVERVRDIVAEYLAMHDKNIKDISSPQSTTKLKVLDFGIIDAMIQLTSSLQITREDQIESDVYLEELDMGYVLPRAIQKAYRIIPGCDNVVERQPKLNALDWCLRTYFDFERERILALRTLKKLIDCTGSYIYKTMIKNTILVLNTVNTDSYFESAGVLTEASLLNTLKYNGLRGIENDLYEFMVRARNANTEDEVMYALKQINTRLTILDDYLMSTDSEKDRNYERWQAVYTKYKAIRDEIAAKKVYNKRNYGIFVDYDKLDNDDNPNGEDYSM